MNSLANKVAIVTGGGQGLGRSIVEVLAEAGAKVVVADINPQTTQATVEALKKQNRTVTGMELDISDAQSIQTTLERVKDTFGVVDIVVNNAAIDVTKPIEELSAEQIDKVIAVNLRGTFLMSKFALKIMYEQGQGQVVNIASTAAKRAWANASAYHATKWGIIGLSRGLYVEARDHGVKVSVVVPGGMRTPFILDRFPDTDPAKLQDPRTVAETVKFVLTQPSDSIIPEVMVIPMQESSWP